MRRKVIWRNEYEERRGGDISRWIAVPEHKGPYVADALAFAFVLSVFDREIRRVGRWKITLKEAPRDGR